jgi:molybdopterin/thiamine biosynthesis adenylyltransferase
MPSGKTIALRLREEGIQKVDSFLSSTCNARRLCEEDVQAYVGRTLIAGWELKIETVSSVRRLQVCLDPKFPFSLPHFFLVDRPEFLVWPHIERDGLLCHLVESKVARFTHPAEMVGKLLGDAYRLVCSSENGQNESDFRTEFYSYWDRSLQGEPETIFSLLRPDGKSRLIRIWRDETQSVVGESDEQVLSWLRHRNGNQPQLDSTDAACLFWLPKALLPREYPRTAGDLYRLAVSTQGGIELLRRFSKLGKSPFYSILGADSGNGPCFAGVKTHKPLVADIRGRRRDHSNHSFRPGKVPKSLMTQRMFSGASSAFRMNVERVDSAWIHGRGYDPHHESLSSKKVVLIGCGSVGAPIAEQLAMAGVGRLAIVDPQDLSWPNVGRHPLGAEHVGHNKAEALAEKLQRSYPHAEIRGFDLSYEDFFSKEPQFLAEADLIICATADWEMESLLNIQRVHGEITQPILYTWTEPHACAGHAVLLPDASPCLQCCMTLSGKARTTVSVWPHNSSETRSEPGCGAVFQPYGPIELQGTISLAASVALDSLLGKTQRAAIHRVWAGPRALLVEAGGDWSDAWRNGYPERENGGLQAEWIWEKDDVCPVCNGSATGGVSSSKLETQSNVSSSLPLSSTT